MTDHVEQLKREIAELERQIAAHPFESLFDKKRADQLYHRLKKKRKELERAESGVGAEATGAAGASMSLFEPAMAEEAPAPELPPESAPSGRRESDALVEPPPKPKPKPKPKVPVKAAAKKTGGKAKVGGPAKSKGKPAVKSRGTTKKNLKPGSVRSGAGKKRSR